MQVTTSLKKILGENAAASGQIINFQKSSMYFQKRTKVEVEERIGALLGMEKCEEEEKYLGFPYLVG